MSSILGTVGGVVSGVVGGVTGTVNTVATTLTSILGPQPSAPATGSSPAMPATGSSVTMASSSSSNPGAGAPYGGLSGTLVAASYDGGGNATAAQIYFPTLGYAATFMGTSIAIKST